MENIQSFLAEQFLSERLGPCRVNVVVLIATFREAISTGLLTLALFSTLVIAPQVYAVGAVGVTWERTYVGIAPASGSVQQIEGGFIMSAEGRGVWVMKANPAGMPEWQKEYTPFGYSVCCGSGTTVVKQTSDGGYIVTGPVLSAGYVTGFDGWLLKLDRRGGVEWSRTYGGANDDSFFSGGQTSDGGYIVAGNTRSFGSPFDASNGWVLRLDHEGRVLWQEVFAAADITSIDRTSDGGFIAAGATGVLGIAALWLFKLDILGGMVWQKAYAAPVEGGVIDDHAFRVHQTSDGGYVVTGDVGIFKNGFLNFSSAWVLRLDSAGDILWQKAFNGGGVAQHVSVSELSDGGFVVSGRFAQSNIGGVLVGSSGPFLLKLSAAGDLVWQKIYGGTSDFLVQVQETQNGGLIAVGSLVTTDANGNCCNNFAWVLKLDSDGNLHGCRVGVPSNATLTDTSAIVTSTTVTGVNTDGTVKSTGVTVTTPTLPIQDLCKTRTNQNLARRFADFG